MMVDFSGTIFLKLPRTKAWYWHLFVISVSFLATIAFIWTMVVYNRRCLESLTPDVNTLLAVNAAATFIFFGAIALMSTALGSSIQDYRGVHSLRMRINTFVTLFAGLMYSLRTFLTIDVPVAYVDMFSTYVIMSLVPLVLLIVYKIWLSRRMIERRLPRVGTALMVFWILFLLDLIVVVGRCIAYPENVFPWPVIVLLVFSALMYLNMMMRYAASSLTLTYYPIEYQKDLERYEKTASNNP